MIVTRKKSHSRRCVICGRKFYSFGHVAEPVAPGRCCEHCHTEHVLPERRRLIDSLKIDIVNDAWPRASD